MLKPFNGSTQNFNLIIRNPFPTLLNYKFSELRDLLLLQSGLIYFVEVKNNSNFINTTTNINGPNYFLIQVNETGSRNLIENRFYEHHGWQKTP